MSFCINRIAIFNNLLALIRGQTTGQKKRARNFLIFKYFLINLLLKKQIISCKLHFQNSSSYWNKKIMKDSLFKKNPGAFLFRILLKMCVQSLRSIVQAILAPELVKCSPLRHLSPAKFLQPTKIQNQIPFKHISNQITICQISFEIYTWSCQTNH